MKFAAPRNAFIQLSWLTALPPVIYFAAFCALTCPRITEFRTHLYAADGDGYQNVWNIWWVNRAVTQLAQSPWHTDHLRYPPDTNRYPEGIPLLGHTLTAFNGFVSIPLLRVLTPEQAYNFMTIFAFVTSGWTMFLLAHRLCAAFWPSIIAGYIFTFCNYHFAHAEGHLNFVSMEWIPLFVLCWYELLIAPRVWKGIAAALALFLLLLCEYNYYFYCLLTAGIVFIWNAIRLRQPLFFIRGEYLGALAGFAVTVLATSGPIVIPLMKLNAQDPLGGHDPVGNSMDLFAPFIYGGHWHYGWLTEGYWRKAMGGNIHESSVYLGWSVIALMAYAWIKRREITVEAIRLWFFVLVFFFVLALGPKLHVEFLRHKEPIANTHWLPYRWLAAVIPGMEVSGFPLRMAVMMIFAAAVICAGAFKLLFAKSWRHRLVAVVLLCVVVFEYLPKDIPAIVPTIPGYVGVVRELPAGGGVLDAGGFSYPAIRKMSGEALSWDMYGWTPSMYHQTYHGRPIAFGFLPRQPASIHARDVETARALINEQFETLRNKFDIRYLVIQDVPPRVLGSPFVTVLYQEGELSLLALENPSLRETPLPFDPIVARDVKRTNGGWEITGEDAAFVFGLPKPQFVTAIRIKCKFEPGDIPVRMQLFWRLGESAGFVETERNQILELPRHAGEQTLTIIVNDTIDQIRLDPDIRPCVFEITELTILTPRLVLR